MIVRPLDTDDVGYALKAWSEAHKTSPNCARASWWAYKLEYVAMFKRLIDDPTTRMLGAYDERDRLLGFLIMTPGKRVHTLHWCQVKSRLDGERVQNRRGIFYTLLDDADLGSRLVYTLRGPKVKTGEARSLDEILVTALRDKGVSATFVPLKEWIK